MADNETYVKLRTLLWQSRSDSISSHADEGNWDVADALEAIWPEVVELLAKIGEYEHALYHELEHGMDPNPDDIYCTDCRSLAQSALDGVNRADFREMITDD